MEIERRNPDGLFKLDAFTQIVTAQSAAPEAPIVQIVGATLRQLGNFEPHFPINFNQLHSRFGERRPHHFILLHLKG